MGDWVRAEDAPDSIKQGQLVLFQHAHWKEPQIQRFDPKYDRRSIACGGFFFMVFEFPAPPEIDHKLPHRHEPT